MSHPSLAELSQRIESIPTLSEVYYTVSAMLENPKVSASQIAEEISHDPALTAKLLKIVNSAFYGLPQQVSTLTHALVLLGFSTVRSLILAMSLADIFSEGSTSRFSRRAFWGHCFASGLIAKNIAQRIGYHQVEEIFIQGLLHDIGKIAIDRYAPDAFGEILHLVESQGLLIRDAEAAVLGYTHAEVGEQVMRQWNLPEPICHATGLHHHPTLAGEQVLEASIIHLADILCRAKGIGSGGDARIPALQAEAWRLLRLDWETLETIMAEADTLRDCEHFFS